MVCTPMYGGQCYGTFARSMHDLTLECTKMGVRMHPHFLFNESLITRARNYCVDEFLRSDFTHLLFIDSDIAFKASDVITMLALQGEDTEYDVIAAPYPKKCITFEKIIAAVNSGIAEDDPNVLEQFVGDFVFNPISNNDTIRLDEPAQVGEAGTGFMMIKRSTFEKYEVAYPQYHYKPDHVRTAAFDGSREIMAYFDCIIDPESRRYLSEDYMFCRNVRKAGMKVWLLPWIHLAHTGTHTYAGSLAAMAQLNLTPTVDPLKLKKAKK